MGFISGNAVNRKEFNWKLFTSKGGGIPTDSRFTSLVTSTDPDFGMRFFAEYQAAFPTVIALTGNIPDGWNPFLTGDNVILDPTPPENFLIFQGVGSSQANAAGDAPGVYAYEIRINNNSGNFPNLGLLQTASGQNKNLDIAGRPSAVYIRGADFAAVSAGGVVTGTIAPLIAGTSLGIVVDCAAKTVHWFVDGVQQGPTSAMLTTDFVPAEGITNLVP